MLVSYGIGGGCLYWVFHGVKPGELERSLLRVNWWWVLPAVILDLLVYVCAAWEWQLLLRPVGRLSIRQAAQALFAGRFANDVLPVHAGYIIRVYLATRWTKTGVAAILPSLLIERLFDALWLALSLGLTILFFPLPASLARTAEILGAAIIAGVAVAGWIILRPGKAGAVRPPRGICRLKLTRKAWSFSTRLALGVRNIGRSWLVLCALGLSIVKLLLQCFAFLALLQAYHFSFSLWVSVGIFVITYVGVSMPSTPAGIGVFQLFCAAGLRFFGIPHAAASSFALMAFVVLTAPLATAGVIAVSRAGLTLSQIRLQTREWKHR